MSTRNASQARNVKFIDRDRGYKAMMGSLRHALRNNFELQLGWFEDETPESYRKAALNEAGVVAAGPAGRPVLSIFVERERDRLSRDLGKAIVDRVGMHSGLRKRGWIIDAIEDVSTKFVAAEEANLRRFILEGYPGNGLRKNAPSTIRNKGFDHPLVETGELARDVRGRVHRIRRKGRNRG